MPRFAPARTSPPQRSATLPSPDDRSRTPALLVSELANLTPADIELLDVLNYFPRRARNSTLVYVSTCVTHRYTGQRVTARSSTQQHISTPAHVAARQRASSTSASSTLARQQHTSSTSVARQ
ncbi:hypothetical protein FISHEDRAFT_71583 [Fistulina hepatica ATCC 64428]|uniref:Uncharacterized protein n=1 Tax=Fistulina hepatica ATCC 64428 TaxID=1128425 RepID=A0A0D7AGX2_9AGAR|nr:hypothetical protein FISHEDRAFT_71583 [Fistulina hepatica ATCC 64428]